VTDSLFKVKKVVQSGVPPYLSNNTATPLHCFDSHVLLPTLLIN